jgi:serpin B
MAQGPMRLAHAVAIASAIVLATSSACAGVPSQSATPSPSPRPMVSPSTMASPTNVPSQPAASPALGLLISDVARATADPAEAATAASAINAFGLDLFRATADGQQGKNIVISPASIALALSMAQLGAVGLTADQMDTVLHGLVAKGETGPLDALDQALTSRTGTYKDAQGGDHEVVLKIANAPFGQRDLAIEPAYLDALASGFGAGLRVVDYKADPEAARALINGWVADQTEQRIKELLQQGNVTAATRLVLVNAIYLKAAWLTAFGEDATKPATFTLGGGTQIQVPTMSSTTSLRYAAGSGWQAVELPYIGDQLAMTIVIPDDLAAFTASLSSDRFAAMVSALGSRPVSLTMPKFSFATRQDLATVLAELGMPLAFSPAADFSGITKEEQLVITRVIHEANIEVDEKGTEAAAATAVVMGDVSGPGDEPVVVHVDRPFLFAIRDLQTGAIVFLGQVLDPSAQ